MLTSPRVKFPDSLDDVYEQAYELGWTDGLPIIPPTEERVQAFVDFLKRDAAEVVAVVPPLNGPATIETIAVNAVMAGCRPEYMPTLLAAIEAVVEPAFNLPLVQAATGPVTPFLVVNGPVRSKIGMNCGSNALGPGNRANATIGRALRFVLLNVGGGIPGSVDKATLGQPGKYTFCLGENEEDNPWEPLHVRRGFRRGDSTVTAFAPMGIHNMSILGQDAEKILTVIANSMTTMGCVCNIGKGRLEALEPMLVLCPTHASVLASAGFSLRDVQQVLWERARIPIDLFPAQLAEAILAQNRVIDGKVPNAHRPEDIMIVVAGGPSGIHSAFLSGCGRLLRGDQEASLRKPGDQCVSPRQGGSPIDPAGSVGSCARGRVMLGSRKGDKGVKEVAIVGVGAHRFGRFGDKPLAEMGLETTAKALKDANLKWKDIQAAYCSIVLGGGTGAGTLTQLGRTSIPICDVTAACASGGVALRNAYMAVMSGLYDVVLCLGFEKAPSGFLPTISYAPWQQHIGLCQNPMYWAMRARRHMHRYGTTVEQLAKVSVKSHKNGSLNPYAMYQRPMTIEEVLNSPLVCDPTHLYMICAPNEGAAAAIVTSMDVARRLTTKPITLAASAHRTSLYPWVQSPSYSFSLMEISQTSPTLLAAKQAYEWAGLGPEDVDVAEVQDTDAFCEIESCEGLGFCDMGEGGRLVDEGATEIGGRIPVNTSGGLISCGEPLGASHLRQVCEIVWQLRGEAGSRQVTGAKVGLAHVVGAQGHCAVTILKA